MLWWNTTWFVLCLLSGLSAGVLAGLLAGGGGEPRLWVGLLVGPLVTGLMLCWVFWWAWS